MAKKRELKLNKTTIAKIKQMSPVTTFAELWKMKNGKFHIKLNKINLTRTETKNLYYALKQELDMP